MKLRLNSLALLIVILGVSLTGCSGFLASYDRDDSPVGVLWGDQFYEHPSPVVRYSAVTGYNVGAILSVPLMVPATAIAIAAKMGEGGLGFISAPYMVMSSACGACAGAPAWALAGWWWPKPVKPQSIPQEIKAFSAEKQGQPEQPPPHFDREANANE